MCSLYHNLKFTGAGHIQASVFAYIEWNKVCGQALRELQKGFNVREELKKISFAKRATIRLYQLKIDIQRTWDSVIYFTKKVQFFRVDNAIKIHLKMIVFSFVSTIKIREMNVNSAKSIHDTVRLLKTSFAKVMDAFEGLPLDYQDEEKFGPTVKLLKVDSPIEDLLSKHFPKFYDLLFE